MTEQAKLLTAQEAAVAFSHALTVTDRIDEYEAERGERRYEAAIPREVMRYGELRLLLGALIVSMASLYPELAEEDQLTALIRDAVVAGASGAEN
jgi:hypothetical protein